MSHNSKHASTAPKKSIVDEHRNVSLGQIGEMWDPSSHSIFGLSIGQKHLNASYISYHGTQELGTWGEHPQYAKSWTEVKDIHWAVQELDNGFG